MASRITRRALFRRTLVASAGVFLASCTGATQKEIVKETVIVEGTPKVVEKVVTAAPGARKVSPPGSLPIVKDRITIRILAPGDRDFNINAFTKWLEEQTNIDLEYIMATGPEAQQKLNLAVASGDLPDVIGFFAVPLSDQQLLAEQGVIIPLDGLIEEYGFETKRLFSTHQGVREQITLLDGKVYGLPNYAEVLHGSLGQKMWIYKPWLDKLGLDMPTTTDEFYEVLKALKTKDPNGNGKADEIPLSAGRQGCWYCTLDTFLMQPFVFNDRVGSKSLMVDDGVIKASYAEPGWREGLRYLNKLYAEGLIDPQAFSNDSTQLRALGENPGVPVLGAMPDLWWGDFTQTGGPSGRYKEYVPLAPLKGPTGLQQIPWSPYHPLSPGQWLITKACANPEAAFRLADFFYSYEATMRNAWGVKDLDWRDAKPGEVGIGGGPAMFAMLRPWATDPDTYMNVGLTYQPTAQRIGVIDDPDSPIEKWLFDCSQKIYAPYGVRDKVLPFLVFSADQSRQLGELTTVIESYADQSFAEFVTGKLDPDKDWDTYIQRLADLGLDKFLKIYQDAYDAKKK